MEGFATQRQVNVAKIYSTSLEDNVTMLQIAM